MPACSSNAGHPRRRNVGAKVGVDARRKRDRDRILADLTRREFGGEA
jgi:hypothetical protein